METGRLESEAVMVDDVPLQEDLIAPMPAAGSVVVEAVPSLGAPESPLPQKESPTRSSSRSHNSDAPTSSMHFFSDADVVSYYCSLRQMPEAYALSNGDVLMYTVARESDGGRGEKRLVFYPDGVMPGDCRGALLLDFECGDASERDFTFAVCTSSTALSDTTPLHIALGTTGVLRPVKAGKVGRLCVCPRHGRATLASYLTEAARCSVQLPSLGQSLGMAPITTTDTSNADKSDSGQVAAADASIAAQGDAVWWRLVVENGESYVRFFNRRWSTSECYCDYPTSFVPGV